MAKHSLPSDLRVSLAAQLGEEPRLLAWAEGEQGQWLVASRREFAHLKDGTWQVWPWEEVLGGGWRKDPASLHWYTTKGQWDCPLPAPGELPGVFRERVQASTVMSATHDVPGGSVTLTARRAPGGDEPVQWLASATGQVDLNAPEIAALVVAETDRLKVEYGL
ncbi:MAG: hypothetical protein Q4D96_09110 [Propionibacteriaceae bacterium]|nr:hypothetical protein [Propionibacteriaceae bacterium]